MCPNKIIKNFSDWRFFQFATGVGGASWTANITVNFQKKIEMALMGYSGARGKLIQEKTWSRKYCGTVPLTFKCLQYVG